MNPAQEASKIIDAIAAGSDPSECVYYQTDIWNRFWDEALSSETRNYLEVVGKISSYHFKCESTHKPFGPIFPSNTGRSWTPTDLTDEELTRLEEICQQLSTTELVARIQDVLWLRRKKLKFAQKAIETYLRCAEARFDLENWVFCADCVERALRLASIHRQKKPELCQTIADVLLNWIQQHADSDKKFLTARAIELVTQFGYGNASELHSVAKKSANMAEEARDFHRAEKYWKIAVKCARLAQDNNAANLAQTALAECYAENARAHKSSGMLASHWMQQAVEAYKSVPGSKEKKKLLYSQLLEYQRASLSEMKPIEHSQDISDIIQATMKSLEDKTIREAIFILAFDLLHPPSYSKLEKQAIELAKNFPLSHLFGATHLDHEGMIVAKSEGTFDSPSEVSSHRVYSLAAQQHQLCVYGSILPAIDIIVSEHYITENDFFAVVVNNPFVAPGQERLYAKGLYAGLTRDFVVATCILIPLLENSLRHVLKSADIRVSSLNDKGIQEVWRIGALLDHEKTMELLGNDIVRDLRGLLIERTYGNLRNQISHGLTSLGTFQQPSVVYLWWLALRLCLTPHYLTMKNAKDVSDNSKYEKI